MLPPALIKTHPTSVALTWSLTLSDTILIEPLGKQNVWKFVWFPVAVDCADPKLWLLMKALC